MQRSYERNLNAYERDPEAAQQLIHSGEFEVHADMNPAKLAALTTVMSLILNLDEVVTKE